MCYKNKYWCWLIQNLKEKRERQGENEKEIDLGCTWVENRRRILVIQLAAQIKHLKGQCEHILKRNIAFKNSIFYSICSMVLSV